MEIKDARSKIDALDKQIVDLFYERMNTSCEIAKVKAAEGLDIYNLLIHLTKCMHQVKYLQSAKA